MLCNHAGPHTAVRRVELLVNSRGFDTARRQITIRSLRRRPLELHSSWRPEGQQGWLFCRWSLLRSRDLLATPFRSGLPPLFWSNTPFADFCDMIKVNRFTLSPFLSSTPRRSGRPRRQWSESLRKSNQSGNLLAAPRMSRLLRRKQCP